MERAVLTRCLGGADALEFARGALAGPARDAAEAHIEACDDCRRRVADLAREIDVESSPAISRYRTLRPIGAGGMGVVYAAYDPQLKRPIALKLLRRSSEGTCDRSQEQRLLREAQAMAQLSHPNVVAVYDAGEWLDQVFIAMELVEGTTLARWLRERPRSWQEVVRTFIHAGHGLAAAHDKGLVHRDFKPANVLIGTDGRARVTDFGIARAVAIEDDADTERDPHRLALPGGLTQTGAFIGTPAYAAPEQFLGAPTDRRSDQFSFAVALYEALFGANPFEGDSVEQRARTVVVHRMRRLRHVRGVPRAITEAVVRSLAAAPAERFESMSDLLGVLEREVARPRGSGRAVRIAVAAGAATAALVGALAWTHHPAPPQSSPPPEPARATAAIVPQPAAAQPAPAQPTRSADTRAQDGRARQPVRRAAVAAERVVARPPAHHATVTVAGPAPAPPPAPAIKPADDSALKPLDEDR